METVVPIPLPAARRQPVQPYPTLKESWGFVGWYLLMLLVVMGGLLAVVAFILPHERYEPSTNLVLIVAGNLVLLGFLYWRYGRRMMPLQVRGQAPGWLYAALPLLTAAAIMVLSLQGFLELPNWFQASFERMARQPAAVLLLGGLVIPVLEEVMFRGLLLQGLLRQRRPWVAIGQQALLFGLVHFNPSQSLNAFFLGLLLGWLCYRTGSLLVCIGIHALNNLLAFGMMIWLPEVVRSQTSLPDLLGSNWAYAGLVALGAGVLGLLLWRVSRLPLPAAWDSAPNSPEPDLEN
ncbi:CPBP family intramembrane glutamic endopeptidase [Hymenobacter aerophilus]|uniref:CPBP family intramembrane glutamic endopeptidase n=1 Tax=Hymenobacter aerophilus TaxID=119644 RepID=UPI000A02C300|nr:type II CAAX endopeptidase family protein [Hymenobacter aerophilus]